MANGIETRKVGANSFHFPPDLQTKTRQDKDKPYYNNSHL